MFPLESAVTGSNVCGAGTLPSRELHTTGDVAFAFHRQFLYTRNLTWLRETW
jgi:trehalose/maltose hydrolase-like predicted phosphorylase